MQQTHEPAPTVRRALPPDVDPELWKAGEAHLIPRIRGRAYLCTVTRVLPSVIEFRGPTGPGAITKDLYRKLVSR